MSIIFIVMLILFGFAYFIKYPYKIKADYTVYENKLSIEAFLVIPVNKIEKIKKGQNVSLFLGSIPNMYGKNLFATIDSIHPDNCVDNSGGYYKVRILLKNATNYKFLDIIRGKAEVDIGNYSFWERINLK